MCPDNKQELFIKRGKTFSQKVRWKDLPLVYVPITGISKAVGPAVITAPGHGVPDGWEVAVISVQGMTQINARNWPLRDDDFHRATVVDANTLSINSISVGNFDTYARSGFVVFFTPHTLAGYGARFVIKDKLGVGGQILLGPLTEATGILLNNSTKIVEVLIPTTVTGAITWDEAVYELDVISPDIVPVVTQLLSGRIVALDELITVF